MIKRVAGDTTSRGDAAWQEELPAEAHRVYDTYVKPFEQEHRGKYVAVTSDGKLVFAASEIDALRNGVTTLGPHPFLFVVGGFASGLRR